MEHNCSVYAILVAVADAVVVIEESTAVSCCRPNSISMQFDTTAVVVRRSNATLVDHDEPMMDLRMDCVL